MEKEKDNFIRLEKGVHECILIIENLLKSIEEKTNSLKNIFAISKSFEHTSIKLDQNDNDEQQNFMKKCINNNLEIFFNLYEKNKTYFKKLSLILENLKVYHFYYYRNIVLKLLDLEKFSKEKKILRII